MKKPLGTILGVLCFVVGAALILAGLSPLWQAAPPPPGPPEAAAPVVTPTSDLLDDFAPGEAVGELDRDVTDAGADLNHRTLHLALGFATGGFAQDPVAQRAMSEVGQQFLSHLLVPGDTVSMFGFEKRLGPGAWNLPFGTEAAPQIAALWSQLKPGAGGIDYNGAILGALPNLKPQENHDTVLVLIAPWDASQSAASDRTAPKFADLSPAVLAQYGLKRMPPFKVSYHQKVGNVTRAVYLTVVLPTRLSGGLLTPDRHACLTQASVAAAAAPRLTPDAATPPVPEAVSDAPSANGANGALIGTGVLLLIVGGVLLALPSPTAGKITVLVGGGSQDFYGPWKSGEVICRFAGGGLPAETGQRTITVGTAPPVVIAEIRQGPSGPVIRSDHLITASGGQAGQAGLPLRKGPPQPVKIEGKSASQSGLPPTPFSVPLEITLA